MEVVKGPDIIHETQFDHLVTAYQTALLRMCYVYLKDRAMAEDAVQETYLKAYKSIENFRGECSEKSWLMRIAINTCRDMQRTGWFKHMDRRITPELLAEKSVVPREDDSSLAIEMMGLPGKLQEVLLLYYYQGMTIAEVGKILGISNVTVSHRLKQAKERLRGALNGGDLRD
jgi:RNA polymerase sigma-70 factor (ECF subfamily)